MEGKKEDPKTTNATTTTGSSVFLDPISYLDSCHHCGRSKYKITPTSTRSISAPFTFPAPPATAATAPFSFPRSDNVSLPTAAATPCCEVPVMAASQAVQGMDPLPIAIPPATRTRNLFCNKATDTSTDGQRVAKRLSPSLHSLVEHTEVLKKLKRCLKELRTVVSELEEAIEEYQIFLDRKEEEEPDLIHINSMANPRRLPMVATDFDLSHVRF